MKLQYYLWLALLSNLGSLVSVHSAWAQQTVASDGSLFTQVSSSDGSNFTITDGIRAGGNLFHSFNEFSVPNGGSVTFNNAPDIVNIIGRVTGDSISNIDGLIRTKGTANLFLINPNGIIFGTGTQLDVGGSFLASTASAIKFANGIEFSAKKSLPLLTVNVPVGLQYNGTEAGIEAKGANLAVKPGNTLALVGSSISLNNSTTRAEGGRVELGSVKGKGTVELTVTNNRLQLSFPSKIQLGNVSLTNGTLVSTSGKSGGQIQLIGKKVNIVDSRVEANTLGSESGGKLNVLASDSLGIINNNIQLTEVSPPIENPLAPTETTRLPSGLFSNVQSPENSQDAGLITINTPELMIKGGAQIAVNNNGIGNGGGIEIQANYVLIDNLGNPNPENLDAGGIRTRTASGVGGDIILKVLNLLVMRRSGTITTDAEGGLGNGGKITISTDIFTSIENSNTTAKAVPGQGGNINITAKGIFLALDSVINASSQLGINGQINTNALGINSQVNANTLAINNQVNNNTLGIDQSKAFVVPPSKVFKLERLVAQGCSESRLQDSKFTITGQGGLPPNPNDSLINEMVLADWGTTAVVPQAAQQSKGAIADRPNSIADNPVSPAIATLVEAQGWIMKNGKVILTAQPEKVILDEATPGDRFHRNIVSASCNTQSIVF